MIVSTLPSGFEIRSTIEPKAEDFQPCKSQSLTRSQNTGCGLQDCVPEPLGFTVRKKMQSNTSICIIKTSVKVIKSQLICF